MSSSIIARLAILSVIVVGFIWVLGKYSGGVMAPTSPPPVIHGTPPPPPPSHPHAMMPDAPDSCNYSAWTAFSPCSEPCGTGQKIRYRTTTSTSPQCTEDTQDIQDCNTQECPVDCALSPYGDWSACTAKCGGGLQHRIRSIETEPNDIGKACNTLINVRDCNTQDCPGDCVLSPWSAWSDCDRDCGQGESTRTRTVLKQPTGGFPCPETTQIKPCNIQPCVCTANSPSSCLDCQFSDWFDWSECSKDCGGGVQQRHRAITRQALRGGKPCPLDPSALQQQQACNTDPCPVDCAVGPWSAYDETQCASCGQGRSKVRSRSVVTQPAHGGEGCPALVEHVPCPDKPCPVNCKQLQGQWVPDENDAHKTCGVIHETKNNTIQTYPAHGGTACPYPPVEHRTQNLGPCPILGGARYAIKVPQLYHGSDLWLERPWSAVYPENQEWGILMSGVNQQNFVAAEVWTPSFNGYIHYGNEFTIPYWGQAGCSSRVINRYTKIPGRVVPEQLKFRFVSSPSITGNVSVTGPVMPNTWQYLQAYAKWGPGNTYRWANVTKTSMGEADNTYALCRSWLKAGSFNTGSPVLYLTTSTSNITRFMFSPY